MQHDRLKYHFHLTVIQTNMLLFSIILCGVMFLLSCNPDEKVFTDIEKEENGQNDNNNQDNNGKENDENNDHLNGSTNIITRIIKFKYHDRNTIRDTILLDYDSKGRLISYNTLYITYSDSTITIGNGTYSLNKEGLISSFKDDKGYGNVTYNDKNNSVIIERFYKNNKKEWKSITENYIDNTHKSAITSYNVMNSIGGQDTNTYFCVLGNELNNSNIDINTFISYFNGGVGIPLLAGLGFLGNVHPCLVTQSGSRRNDSSRYDDYIYERNNNGYVSKITYNYYYKNHILDHYMILIDYR